MLFVAVFTFVFVSCSSEPQTPEKKVTTTVSTTTAKADPGSYFLVKKEIRVKKGETVWGYAKVYYKDGFRWRDIVAQNPFLEEQGRIEVKKNGECIVTIIPGETIRMGTEVVTPTSYTISETTTETTTTTPASAPATPSWIWFLVGAVILAVIFYGVRVLFPNRNNHNGSLTSIVHVNIGQNGQGIDAATHAATARANVNRAYEFRERTAEAMLSNPNLVHAHMSESSDQSQRFELYTDYDPTALQPQQPAAQQPQARQ